MARVNNIATLVQRVEGIEDLRRFCAAAFSAILSQVNGRLDFGDNIRAFGPIDVVFPNGTDVVTVTHGLGRTPQGFIVINLNAGEVVYQPSGALNAFTPTTVFLQASGAVTASIILI